MSRGRPPKPTALKILSGNPGKRPLPEEREVDHGAAVKPAWLAGADPLPGMVWDELAPGREALGLLTSVTAEEFAVLCVYWAEFRRKGVDMDGSARKDFRAHLNAFGFNPSALAKLGIATAKPAKKNPFSVLSS
jgi:hypothetical protein